MALAPEKRLLLTRQQNERAKILARIDYIEAEERRELESYEDQAYGQALNREINRKRGHHAEKSFWEYLNAIIEPMYWFIWKQAMISACTKKHHRLRQELKRDLLDLEAQHLKEQVALRYNARASFSDYRPNVRLQPPDDPPSALTDLGDTTNLPPKTPVSMSPRFLPKAPA